MSMTSIPFSDIDLLEIFHFSEEKRGSPGSNFNYQEKINMSYDIQHSKGS